MPSCVDRGFIVALRDQVLAGVAGVYTCIAMKAGVGVR